MDKNALILLNRNTGFPVGGDRDGKPTFYPIHQIKMVVANFAISCLRAQEAAEYRLTADGRIELACQHKLNKAQCKTPAFAPVNNWGIGCLESQRKPGVYKSTMTPKKEKSGKFISPEVINSHLVESETEILPRFAYVSHTPGENSKEIEFSRGEIKSLVKGGLIGELRQARVEKESFFAIHGVFVRYLEALEAGLAGPAASGHYSSLIESLVGLGVPEESAARVVDSASMVREASFKGQVDFVEAGGAPPDGWALACFTSSPIWILDGVSPLLQKKQEVQNPKFQNFLKSDPYGLFQEEVSAEDLHKVIGVA
jgi:hypothetical protein